MRREPIDIFLIERRHHAVHARLLNWAEWARVRGYPKTSPMFAALGVRTNSRQWHTPDIRDTIDPLDAMKVEKVVAQLPDRHAAAVRWWYVYQKPPVRSMARALATNEHGLARYCTDARTMVDNRLKLYTIATA